MKLIIDLIGTFFSRIVAIIFFESKISTNLPCKVGYLILCNVIMSTCLSAIHAISVLRR